MAEERHEKWNDPRIYNHLDLLVASIRQIRQSPHCVYEDLKPASLCYKGDWLNQEMSSDANWILTFKSVWYMSIQSAGRICRKKQERKISSRWVVAISLDEQTGLQSKRLSKVMRLIWSTKACNQVQTHPPLAQSPLVGEDPCCDRG